MNVYVFLSAIFLFLQYNQAQANKYDNEEVAQFLCFSETLGSGKNTPSTVCHVGIEVKTKSGRKYTIHNLGPDGADTTVELIEKCNLERYRSPKWHALKGFTVGKLREAGGTNYGIILNNCYHARNRILKLFGLALILHCPDTYASLKCTSLDSFKHESRCM
ncbi:hypothetical protein ACQ4LE_000740 [Meloidogyne hapla]